MSATYEELESHYNNPTKSGQEAATRQLTLVLRELVHALAFLPGAMTRLTQAHEATPPNDGKWIYYITVASGAGQVSEPEMPGDWHYVETSVCESSLGSRTVITWRRWVPKEGA